MPVSQVKIVKDFFGMSLTEMKKEWTNGGLTPEDKAEIVTLIEKELADTSSSV